MLRQLVMIGSDERVGRKSAASKGCLFPECPSGTMFQEYSVPTCHNSDVGGVVKL
jgi:hypothetical protein